MKYYLLLLFTILLSTSWSDDYVSISTSRPGVYNPTSSVPKGLYQLEVGTNLSTGPGMDTLLTMPALLRLGVINNTEFDIQGDINNDGILNVLDVILLVNLLLV